MTTTIEHAVETVNELERRGLCLMTTARDLRKHFAMDDGPLQEEPEPEQDRLDVTAKGKAVLAGTKRSVRPLGDEALKIVAAARGLKEPFRTDTLAEAAGIPHKQASNWINNRIKDGWLKRTGFGEYQRLAAFGKVTAKAGRSKPAREPGEGSRLLEQIHGEIESGRGKAGE
jgi:predicted Rossmann fold nucleotide-binding protein DprA/Smf involved in DNA uptake